MDLLSYLMGKNANEGGGGGTTSRDWSLIGYTSEPDYIEAGYQYAKQIYDNWDTSITDGSNMFYENTDLIFFPLVDTSNITDMSWMFQYAIYLQKIPAIDTSHVTNMRYMFSFCPSLREIDFTNFDTSSCTDMHNMFFRNFGLYKITLPFNTSHVTTMEGMFKDCWLLKEIDLSSFTSEALTNTKEMFYNCRSLTKIDLRKFTFNSTTTASNMFGTSGTVGPANDCLIIVKDDTEKAALQGKVSRLTNIKTVAEYEASLN